MSPGRGGILVAHGVSRGKVASEGDEALEEGGIKLQLDDYSLGYYAAPAGALIQISFYTHGSRRGLLLYRPCRGSEHRRF